MPTELEASDRFAILELIARYSWAIDTLDVEAYVSNFTAEAVLGIRDARYRSQAIIEGDSSRVSVRSYGQIVQRFADGSCKVVLAGVYRDTCVKVDGRWLFAERLFSEWETTQLDNHRL
jgi:hypothetical protein